MSAALKPTKQQIRQLRRDNAAYPVALREIPSEERPPEIQGHNASSSTRIAVFRSRDFLAQVFEEGPRMLRLSVCRTDWDLRLGRWREDITWDDLQRLKREAGYGVFVAVEVFPADRDVVNVANMRHLWIKSDLLDFAWRRS